MDKSDGHEVANRDKIINKMTDCLYFCAFLLKCQLTVGNLQFAVKKCELTTENCQLENQSAAISQHFTQNKPWK